jgi:glycosyltransferase involved in cell wall biosynthesis
LDWLVAFLGAAVRRDPNIVIELTTRDDPNQVRAAFGSNWELLRKLKISPCSSDRVHEVLQGQMASVMFFTGGLSKLGSSPTRMGEVLGCGLPVVANGGVGDVARIIRKYRVGVLAEGSGCREMEAAWDNLQRLLADPGLATRCRETAEKVFSLKVGTEQYSELYSEILKS